MNILAISFNVLKLGASATLRLCAGEIRSQSASRVFDRGRIPPSYYPVSHKLAVAELET